ncbi:MAG: DUF4163 domain-containing protein [Cytophagaceae bacterium]|nr:DUF4163 domain-containing protein [Cytophagaceae bacterium]
MKYFIYFLCLAVFACSSPKDQKNNKADTAKVAAPSKDTVSKPARAATGVPSDRILSYYNGLIGGKYSIEVTLSESKDSVSGQYRYTSQTAFLTLKGTVTNGEYLIKEFDPFGKNTGTFTGKKNESTKEITGSWTNGKRTFSFVFTPKSNEQFAGGVTIVTRSLQIKDGSCACADFLLPVVTGGVTQTIQDNINSKLTAEAFSFSDSKDDICECSEEGYSYGVTSGSFDVLNNKNNILSIQWCGETMGAYPSGYCTYKNFDIRDGSIIGLSNIYTEEGIEYILGQVNKEINARLEALTRDPEVEEDAKAWIQDLTAERTLVKDDLREFSLDSKGLTIRYNLGFPHAVQCYAPSGDVFIPYTALEKWVMEEGVLGKAQ